MPESVSELKNYPQQYKAAEALLDGANAAQREAIAHHRGPMLVLAGPGSGKTFTIIRRIQYLIQIHGVSPSEILVITFTKAAAKEMQTRFCQTHTGAGQQPQFGTFHSIFFSIIQKHCHYKISDLITVSQQRMLMKQVLLNGSYELTIDLDTMDALLSLISQYKNLGEEVSALEGLLSPEQFQQLYSEYREQMEWHHKIDFDDMLLVCREVLQKQERIRQQWQKRFCYILVDEFQDINPIQYEILQMLAGEEKNLFVVGDDDQAIYGFRGSRPEILLRFPEEYTEARQVLLSCNYRSGKQIVEAAQKVIEENQVRFCKRLHAQQTGGRVILTAFESQREEQEKILQYLQQAQRRKESCALLCRTNRELSEWAKACERAGIVYQHKSREKSVWEEPCGRDLLAYLRLSQGRGSREELLRILNKPMRYLSRECVGEQIDFDYTSQFYKEKPKLREACRKLEQDLHRIGRLSPFLAFHEICRRVGYEAWMLEQCRDEQSRLVLLQQLEQCKQKTMQCKTTAELLCLAEKEEREAAASQEQRTVPSSLSLMTYHASKGLEFATVFLPGLNEGKVPHGKNLSPKEMEEERRMFYVAMTRAKEKLCLTYLVSETENVSQISAFLQPLMECR